MNQCKDCGIAERAPGRSRCYPCYGLHRRTKAPASGMKVLYLDIETTPNKVWAWDIWNQNIGINQIIEPTRMMCFSAKWQAQPGEFHSEWRDSHESMVARAYELLDEADVVVHYYGSKFDIPHLNREFLVAGYTPPSPYKQVDLKLVVAKMFKFPSAKLQYVTTALGFDGKHKTDFDLWADTMGGDPKARKKMERYNRQDTDLLEELYGRLLPWVPQLPNRNLYDGAGGCAACGSLSVEEDGVYYTALSRYRRYACRVCGYWMRSSKRINGVSLQGAVI
jgi:uncharacterized protein